MDFDCFEANRPNASRKVNKILGYFLSIVRRNEPGKCYPNDFLFANPSNFSAKRGRLPTERQLPASPPSRPALYE